jgi:hypothetical protein
LPSTINFERENILDQVEDFKKITSAEFPPRRTPQPPSFALTKGKGSPPFEKGRTGGISGKDLLRRKSIPYPEDSAVEYTRRPPGGKDTREYG